MEQDTPSQVQRIASDTDYISIFKWPHEIRIPKHLPHFATLVKEHFDVYSGAVFSGKDGIWDFSKPARHCYQHSGLEFDLTSLPEEPEVIECYFKHYTPAPGDLAFDIGAYCGLTTYEMDKRGCRVIAFEPDAENLKALYQNMVRHCAKSTWVKAAIVGDRDEEVDFFSEGTPGSRLAKPEYKRGPICKVEALSLRDTIRQCGIPKFIKMDIEGAEVEVLAESRTILSRESISLAIDTHHGNPRTTAAVESILRDCGYKVETLYPSGFATTLAWK